MAKTKADLQRDLKTAKRGEELWKGHARKAQDGELEAFRQVEALEEKYKDLLNRFSVLADKHDVFVEKHRSICEAHSRQMDVLEENLNDGSKEIVQAKAKIAAQESRIMVCETAMRSMTIHIAILEQMKGKTNAKGVNVCGLV